MRRVATITSLCLVLMVAGGCRDDGRTLRPAKPGQSSSVSTTSPVTEVTDGGGFTSPDLTGVGSFDLPGDSTLDTSGSYPTLPPSTGALSIIAPWRDGAAIDPRYTCDSLNLAPALSWSAAPAGTVEIAITLTDLDNPTFVHWAIAGISPLSIALDEDTVPIGAYEGTNSNGSVGYTGPCPPAGSAHTYAITVHYLESATGLDDGTPGAQLITAVASVEAASAEVTGTFSRT